MGRFDVQTSGGMSGASAYVYSLVDGIVGDHFDAIPIPQLSQHCTYRLVKCCSVHSVLYT